MITMFTFLEVAILSLMLFNTITLIILLLKLSDVSTDVDMIWEIITSDMNKKE